MRKISVLLLIISVFITLSACSSDSKRTDTPEIEFSTEKMFSLKIYEPWIYESLHYTLLCDGTLIVQYFDDEIDREKLSDERMAEIRKIFSPEKVYNMDIGQSDDSTDGVQRYIILYDKAGNEIKIGGYELSGGDNFDYYFEDLYNLMEDDFTRVWSDRLWDCVKNETSFRELYLKPETNQQ